MESSKSILTTARFREQLASKAFRLIEEYDRHIAQAYAKAYSNTDYYIPLR